MRQRCSDPNQNSYKYYGGRGITVCNEWQSDFFAFQAWAKANGYKPGLFVDRIDVNKGYSPDNCRFATRSENARNQGLRKTNRSGYKGVCFNKGYGKWGAYITVDGKWKHLGFFDDPEIAAKAYDSAATKYHGEFANLNSPINV